MPRTIRTLTIQLQSIAQHYLFDVQTMHGIIQKWLFAGYSWAQAIPQSTILNEGFGSIQLLPLALEVSSSP